MGQVNTHICSNCGSVGLPGDKFCRKCGKPLKSENRCEKCGNIVQPKDHFCVKCGSSLTHKTAAIEKPQTAKEKKIGTSYVVIGKMEIARKNYSFLTEFINSISLPQIKSGDGNYARMVIAINGYDDDVRSLWDIPEVVEWYKDLHNHHPYMPLFLSPGSVQVYFRVLGPIAHTIVPPEYCNQKDLVSLLMHTLAERNKFFSHVLGSEFERYQRILGAADEAVTNAVINLTNGIQEPV